MPKKEKKPKAKPKKYQKQKQSQVQTVIVNLPSKAKRSLASIPKRPMVTMPQVIYSYPQYPDSSSAINQMLRYLEVNRRGEAKEVPKVPLQQEPVVQPASIMQSIQEPVEAPVQERQVPQEEQVFEDEFVDVIPYEDYGKIATNLSDMKRVIKQYNKRNQNNRVNVTGKGLKQLIKSAYDRGVTPKILENYFNIDE